MAVINAMADAATLLYSAFVGRDSWIPTGQWSDPITSGMMNAFETDPNRFSVTKK